MRRWVPLLAILAGCEAPADKPPAPTEWATPPLPAAWTGVPGASIGRGQAPQLVAFAGLNGTRLEHPRVWPVPGEGPARAIVSGSLGELFRIELYDIDRDKTVWSAGTLCTRVIGVTDKAVLCNLTGKPEILVLDITTGTQVGTTKLGVEMERVRAVCGDGEVFAQETDGRFMRLVNGELSWTVSLEPLAGLLACDGANVVVTTASGVVSLARATGKETGRIADGAGVWSARDRSDRIEVATAAGVVRVARDLTGPREMLEPLPLGRHIATYGELRLVASSSTTAVLLDGKGVRAYLPFAYESGAIGTSTVLTGNATLRSIVVPPRETRALDIKRGPQRYIAVPAELRDLPAAELLGDGKESIEAPGNWEAVGLIIVGEAVNLIAVPHRDTGDAAVVRFDARTRSWSERDDVCNGPAFRFAMLGERVVCVTSLIGLDQVRSEWVWRSKDVDAIAAAADSVLAFDSDRMTVLDAKSGRPRGVFTSDHGGRMQAAALDIGLLVTAERNRIVARAPAAQFAPAWSVDVRGSVAAIHAADAGVVVELDDGDVYRIDARTGQPSSLGAVGGVWAVAGDRILAAGPGGALPVAGWPPAPVEPTAVPKKAKKAAAKDDDDVPRPPRLVTPIAPPANLRPAWQVSLFDLAGVLRARNDYALAPPVTPGHRGPGAPLILVGDADKTALVVDPESGAPQRRIELPMDTDPTFVFSLVVDGKPITGVVRNYPLRVVLF